MSEHKNPDKYNEMSESLKANYESHIDSLRAQWRDVLSRNHYDAAVVPAGENKSYYEDDQEPPFHAFGHFLRWVPHNESEHAVLVIPLEDSPVLFWHTPTDYWYLPSSAPSICDSKMRVRSFESNEQLQKELSRFLATFQHVAILGRGLRYHESSSNDTTMTLRQLDYLRTYKTEFEQNCMRLASRRGVRGHLAAANAFKKGASELEINHAFLQGSEQHQAELPYPNIVAINEHAATLHYQRYDQVRPKRVHSLLIDAGAKAVCYHADITRTYATPDVDEFAELVAAVNDAQQAQIKAIEIGIEYLSLHEEMHRRVANILVDLDFIRCSAEAAFEHRVTDAFFPHGLGHLLGLQTHDVGGHIPKSDGVESVPHERFQSLRILRTVEANMVFTIEPGIYFIPSLLDKLPRNIDLNWEKIERFVRYGGVRIEDNVLVTANGVENLTRDAFNDAELDETERVPAT